MVYRNSIVGGDGRLYSLFFVNTIDEILGKTQPACLQEGEGIILIYEGIIIDVYSPDKDIDVHTKWVKNLGYPTLPDSVFGYFTWEADEEIDINHDSPFIYYDSSNGQPASQGIIFTKVYEPHVNTITVEERGEFEFDYVRSKADDKMKEDEQMYAFKNEEGGVAIYYVNTQDPTTSTGLWSCEDGTWQDESQGAEITAVAVDKSPFEDTAITGVQTTASTNAVVRGGERFFKGCTSLRYVVAHNATYFGDECFYGCTALDSMSLSPAPCSFGTDCFGGNAGVNRGTIWADSRSTAGAGWVWSDVPAALQAKHWVVRNYDESAYSDRWQVNTYTSFEGTITFSPELGTLEGVEGSFATAEQAYTITVSDIPEGQSVQAWFINNEVYIPETLNPLTMTFIADTWIEPLLEVPHVDPKEKEEDAKEVFPEKK